MAGLAMKSRVDLRIVKPPQYQGSVTPARELTLSEILRFGFPSSAYPEHIRQWKRRNLKHLYRGLRRVLLARVFGIGHLYGQLCYVLVTPDGQRQDYGLVSMRVVTSAAAAYLADGFQGLSSINVFKYHGVGTGGTLEAASQTALTTELSAYYQTPSTRPTGSLEEGSSANIYRTIASMTITTTAAIAEHGIFSQASTAGGTMLDRSLTDSISLQPGVTILPDYRLTIGSGT